MWCESCYCLEKTGRSCAHCRAQFSYVSMSIFCESGLFAAEFRYEVSTLPSSNIPQRKTALAEAGFELTLNHGHSYSYKFLACCNKGLCINLNHPL